MARVYRIVEIDAGENGEDVGLQEGHQKFQRREHDDQDQRQGGAEPAERRRNPPSMMMKPANTCSVMWPASMLANRRTLCEIGREMNDSTSMTTIAGRM